MRKRRIVQISTDVVETTMTIHALCDDGTVWLKFGNEDWMCLQNIPQPSLPDPFPEGVQVVEEPFDKGSMLG